MKDLMFIYRVRLLSGQTIFVKSRNILDVVKAKSFWKEDFNGNLERTRFVTLEGRVLEKGWGSKIVLIEELPMRGLIRDCLFIVGSSKGDQYK